jgi:hypothetical protein
MKDAITAIRLLESHCISKGLKSGEIVKLHPLKLRSVGALRVGLRHLIAPRLRYPFALCAPVKKLWVVIKTRNSCRGFLRRWTCSYGAHINSIVVPDYERALKFTDYRQQFAVNKHFLAFRKRQLSGICGQGALNEKRGEKIHENVFFHDGPIA